MRVRTLIRYLPALAVGLLLAQLSLILLSYAANYMLRYLISAVDLNANSIQYLWLILHDVSLLFILSAIVYFGYRKFLSTLPDDLFSAILMQLPITYISLYLLRPSFDLSSLASSASTISSVTASISVLLVYGLNSLARRRTGTTT
ncbi:hypothetical protein [Shewanella hanedai]|uniref:Uncharacterized protein n=1 Tax=Shewanella hanedai TaxID=25 RepID=A0A553JMW6_SHEHA|nr:hypothetical protein [Shewanella hanedai]TRY13773.1 hypothetical protein FN961_13925 [Shewanella hanedai]